MSDMQSERDRDYMYFQERDMPKPVYLPDKRRCARCDEWKEGVTFVCRECFVAMGILTHRSR